MIDKLKIGQCATLTKTVRSDEADAFARLTGDSNPVHLDEEYARDNGLRGRIAHGMLVGAYISAVLGTKLPGPGAIYLAQTLSFKAPVLLGDEVTVRVTVKSIRQDRPVVVLTTDVRNQCGDVVVDGEAVMYCKV